MRNRASMASLFTPTAPRSGPRATPWIERAVLRLLGLPTPEQVEERMRNYRGFYASLTPEQRAAREAYDGPEVLGPANGPRRQL